MLGPGAAASQRAEIRARWDRFQPKLRPLAHVIKMLHFHVQLVDQSAAEAYGSRTHPRHPTVPRNGFEDRETHRDPSAPKVRARAVPEIIQK